MNACLLMFFEQDERSVDELSGALPGSFPRIQEGTNQIKHQLAGPAKNAAVLKISVGFRSSNGGINDDRTP
jgi:hypothetical protein